MSPATLAAWKAEGADSLVDYGATPDQSKPAAAKSTETPKPKARPKSRPVTYEKISPLYSGNGIVADFRGAKEFHHHYVIRNCIVPEVRHRRHRHERDRLLHHRELRGLQQCVV